MTVPVKRFAIVLAATTFIVMGVTAQRRKPRPEKPEQVLASADYKAPSPCSEVAKGIECLEGFGGTSSINSNGLGVGFDQIRLANGKTRLVIVCDDYTRKPKACPTPEPPKPHPETFAECMGRRYRAYERVWDNYLMPPGVHMSRNYSDTEKQEFIRTIAAMDEKGKDECKGKPID